METTITGYIGFTVWGLGFRLGSCVAAEARSGAVREASCKRV